MTTTIVCCMFTLDRGLYNRFWQNQMLLNNVHGTKDQLVVRALCDYLQQNLTNTQPQNNNNQQFCEKLAIMVIDGSVRLGVDPVQVSDEFISRGITLAIVAVVTPVYETWDFYRELARNTGGEYMLIENASVVLSRVISSVLTGENTLRQAFLRERRENIPVASNNQAANQTINNIQDMDFDHGLSY